VPLKEFAIRFGVFPLYRSIARGRARTLILVETKQTNGIEHARVLAITCPVQARRSAHFNSRLPDLKSLLLDLGMV